MRIHNNLITPFEKSNSVNIVVTYGCCRGKCSYCDFKDTYFTIETLNAIRTYLHENGTGNDSPENAYIAFDDAIALPNDYIVEIIKSLKEEQPSVKTIVIGGKSEAVLMKTYDELLMLRESGLTGILQNIVTGNDFLLDELDADSSSDEHIEAAALIKDTGLVLYQSILLGLSSEHSSCEDNAIMTARHLSEMNPEYVIAHPARATDEFLPLSILKEIITLTGELNIPEWQFMYKNKDLTPLKFSCKDHSLHKIFMNNADAAQLSYSIPSLFWGIDNRRYL